MISSSALRRFPAMLGGAPSRFFTRSAPAASIGVKDFDVVVYGASGYTGRLVAEHMQQVVTSLTLLHCSTCLMWCA